MALRDGFYNVSKKNLLYCFKWMGFFKLSKRLTQNGLRILCYHNFSIEDELLWRPLMNIKPETFRKRINYLLRENYPILTLDNAIELLYTKKNPCCATVITIDDGWASIKKLAHPILKEKKIKYSIYCSTYYTAKMTPVFNYVLPYLVWKAKQNGIKLSEHITGMHENSLIKEDNFLDSMINYGHNSLTNTQRMELLNKIIGIIGLEHEMIFENRRFSYLSYSELEELTNDGVDLQLHTHRHKLPLNYDDAKREIEDNRRYLSPLSKKPLRHFCYPSGLWNAQHFSILKKLDIVSATTTDPGINYSKQNQYKLGRFVDGEMISQIVFEAELSGFLDFMRSL